MALNSEQHMLMKLAEEGSEVSQIALKSIQFTLNEKREGQPFTNKERIHQELNDMMGVIRLLNRDHNFQYVLPDFVNHHNGTLSEQEFIDALNFNNAAVIAKEEKINKYKDYSRILGTVVVDVPLVDEAVEKPVETVENFKVVCDATNNTPESLAKNELHIDISIKPFIGFDPAHPEGDKTVEHEIRKL